MGNKASFWNKHSEKYARDPIKDQASYERKLELTRAHLGAGSQVLEFGCGTGSTAILHAPYAAHILATDVASGMLEIGRRRALEAGIENITFQELDMDTDPLPENQFDMVMAHSILHLLDDHTRAIGAAWSALKPGGVFVSSTMCMADGFWFLRPFLWVLKKAGLVPHVNFLTGGRLVADIQARGFEIVEDWRPGKRKAVFVIARKPA